MTQHQPHNQLAPPRNGAGAPAAAWAAWVREQWDAVRVLRLDITRLADVVGRAQVRAVIHLGSLSPADVRVDVVAGAPEPAAGAEQWTSELYSAQSYRNGTFVFEGLAGVEALEGERLLSVFVRPRGARDELSGLSVVARSSGEQPEQATRVQRTGAEQR